MSGMKFAAAAALAALLLAGCAADSKETVINEPTQETEITEEEPAPEITDENEEPEITEEEPTQEITAGEDTEKAETEVPEEQPQNTENETAAAFASYIKITADSVNIRAGAGTKYTALGVSEKDTLYLVTGGGAGWYETYYKGRTAYINASYCEEVTIDKSDSDDVETVIEKGCALLGTKYVYGAVRYHDGTGKLNKYFTVEEFDCSSLTQYIFKIGANVNLQVNTRTQIYQGTTVKKSAIERGDLLFFTNSSRCNNTGIERVGHVALYLGDGYILHTSSDYAKIEKISSARWNYYIRAQRVI